MSSSLSSPLLDFTFKIYKQLAAADGQQNVVFSPVSLSAALSLALLGTGSTTGQQLALALFGKTIGHHSAADSEYESLAKQIGELFSATLANNSTAVQNANLIYTDHKFTVEEEYRRLVTKYLSATARQLDFKSREAVQVINADISSATNGKIQDIIQSIDNMTVAILANALYFKGVWKSQFNKDLTFTDKFTTASGNKIDVQMMYQHYYQRLPFGYSQRLKTRAVELDYSNCEATMLLLLPDDDKEDNQTLGQLVSQLNAETLNELVAGMRRIEVDLYLPKFKVESSHQLIPALNKSGITEMFDQSGAADFSRLSANGGVYISQVYQKVVIDMSEEGTEAAAATVIVANCMSMPRMETFKADRPFLYLLVTKSAGDDNNQISSILFMGECNDPSA
ncbi:leukocyte elastase inhibitor-like [Oppia nitens]|uniref:leukocyte elastase inhibitor-like n=1 Tax=Oppia nitens TaxID=1686743 RepID=UPI0023DA5428|nr:leukocyte elastase inhibitor-like [Oppia nitens]